MAAGRRARAAANLGRSREKEKKRCGRAPSCPSAGGEAAARGVTMAPRILPLAKLVVKGALAGGAVYVVYDQGLLRGSEDGARALQKAQEALPPAVEEWVKYFGWELPAVPKTEFSFCNAWNSGVRTAIGALSVAPTRATEYTHDGWKYVKNLTK